MRIIKNKNIIITVLSFIFGIILSGMFIVLMTSSIREIKDCIRYEKVYQNPVVVTGTICDIDVEEEVEDNIEEDNEEEQSSELAEKTRAELADLDDLDI